MKLRHPLSCALAALLVAAPVAAEQAHAPQAQGGVAISVGQARDLSHIEFKGGAVQVRREADKVLISFGPGVKGPDLSRLKVNPPRWVKTAEASTAANGRLTVTLTLTEDAEVKTGQADGATFINLYAKPADAAAPAPIEAPAGPPRADPVPASGVVVAQAVKSGPQTTLTFPWKAPAPAAMFRRGDAIWVVFDAKARLDVQSASHVLTQYPMRVIDGPDFVALRIAVPAEIPYSAAAVGANWSLILGPGAQARSLNIAMARSEEDGPPVLAANVAGASRVIWLEDPAVGDRIAVTTALGPAKGLILRRAYVDLAALPSAHGLALERVSDNLQVTTDGDVVRITRPEGLALSSPVRTRMAAEVELPQPAIMPGLVNFDEWSKTGAKGFLPRYDGLMNAAAAETNRQALGDKSAGLAARIGLARFLTGSEMGYEAIGVLNLLARSHPEMMASAEFRGLRGASRVIVGRYAEALTDFSAPQLTDDPASALWRGYADAKLGHWTEARQEFQTGAKALKLFSPAWRVRFLRANAEASLRLNDFVTATDQIKQAIAQPQPAMEALATYLAFARLLEAEGMPDKALPIYDAVARAPADYLSAPALLHATQIRLYAGKVSPDKAALTFASLRYRWRGDATELEVTRALGQLYLAQGRYREALDAWRTARQRRSDLPEALQISEDLGAAFRNLFLDGAADGLEPIQAVGLFYDFKELTPIGADGDEMVRKLAQRLVNVDLLDQASQLLQYQAESRLDGVPRAMVATDLAVIQLMARRPEGAINALNSSRNTLLPTALQQQRRLVEARAWLQLNQLDHADEILGADNSADGVSLRAEIAWKRRNWPLSGKTFEQSLGERWKIQDGNPLAPEDESKLLRAATAYSLAQDDAALARLRERYGAFVEKARWPDALRVALAGVNVEQITTTNFAQAISDDQAFAGWATKMRQRFREKYLGGPTPAPVLRPLTTALAEQAGAAAGGELPDKAEPKGKAKAAKARPQRQASVRGRTARG